MVFSENERVEESPEKRIERAFNFLLGYITNSPNGGLASTYLDLLYKSAKRGAEIQMQELARQHLAEDREEFGNKAAREGGS